MRPRKQHLLRVLAPQCKARGNPRDGHHVHYLHYGTVSRDQILQLLGHTGLRRIFASHGGAWLGLGADEAEDDEDDNDVTVGGYGAMLGRRRRRRRAATPVDFPKVPSDIGRGLMNSGTFGSNEYYHDVLRKKKRKLAGRVMNRELGSDAVQDKRLNRLLLQVSKKIWSICRNVDGYVGHDSFVQCRYDNSL